jgi:hypothetical protein
MLHRLKVHKRENFQCSDFEFFTYPCLVKLKYKGFIKIIFDRASIGGDTIVPRILRLRRVKNFQQALYLKMPQNVKIYLAFSEAKHNQIPLSLRLSGIR